MHQRQRLRPQHHHHRHPRWASWFTLLLFTASLVVSMMLPTSADAQNRRRRARRYNITMALGPHGDMAGREDLEDILNAAIEAQIKATKGLRFRTRRRRNRARYFISGAITTFSTSDGRISCGVSLVISERRNGRMRVILNGQAHIDGYGSAIEEAVVKGAVEGAFKQISISLRSLARR